MFTDANLDRSEEGANLRDEDAAKQVQLHVTEAVFPALSEPGLAVAPRRKMGDADAEGPLSTSPNQLDGDKVTGATNHKSVNLEGSLLVQHDWVVISADSRTTEDEVT
ncbi:hypothetical protein JHK87_000774 [Glycine soja]|nr:hypothetical protein JHK87_000774 [Glycine soja]